MFGRSQTDHDNALRAALQRMRENNLTANPDKFLFNQSSIDFFDHRFSADGISADDKKVSSLINASPPRNATEARSFLGLAQYLSRFTKDIRDFKIHYGEVLLRRLRPSGTRVTTANFAPNSND